MKHALFEHKQSNMGLVNIGDHIQSCAAEQFLPQVDFYVERDNLSKAIENEAKIIMNGWFTESPENWPPNPNLKPLFISFHLQPSSAKVILSKNNNVEYLRSYEPIGCRDYKTVELLEKAGIKAYFSFCLTTTLDIKYKSHINSNEILLVDPLYNYNFSRFSKITLKEAVKKISYKNISKFKNYLKPPSKLKDFVPSRVIEKANSINHDVSSNLSNSELYGISKSILKRYSEAKLVITSRIHCALPCLAMGTPVLFVLQGLKDENFHMSRLRGILDHVNILTNDSKEDVEKLFGKSMNVYSPSQINWDNPPDNPLSYKNLSNNLKDKCYEFIKDDKHNEVQKTKM
jgi:hypothetical protein